MTNTMTREELLSAIARNINDYDDPLDHELPGAALQAIEDAGGMVVPVEPTEAMLDRFVSRALQVSINGEGGWSEYGRNQYKAMLKASPMAKK